MPRFAEIVSFLLSCSPPTSFLRISSDVGSGYESELTYTYSWTRRPVPKSIDAVVGRVYFRRHSVDYQFVGLVLHLQSQIST